MKLLEKYYNINYYCTYKLLFFLCWRLLNPLYWLPLLEAAKPFVLAKPLEMGQPLHKMVSFDW